MLKKLFRYYIPYKKILGLALAGAVITSLIELVFPLYMRYILNDILPMENIGALLQAAAGLLLLYLLNCFINYKVMISGRLVGALIERDMRRAISGMCRA